MVMMELAALYFNTDDKIHMYFDGNTHPYGPINSRVYRDTTNLASYRLKQVDA